VTLRTKLMLITTAVVILLFGVSEWLSYRHITALLDQHESILIETTNHAVALEHLRATRDHALLSATSIRILNAAGTLVLAVAVLNLVWYRVIFRPIRQLLSHMNVVGRGTWTHALPVERNDEIGELTAAFNDLGRQLTSTFRHINSSSKLSAMALLGGRLAREVSEVRVRIAGSARVLNNRKDARMAAVAAELGAAEERLARLETAFQSDFDEELTALQASGKAQG
jgi:HAMP domain-containing protein